MITNSLGKEEEMPIINNRKFAYETSEELHRSGDGKALFAENGLLEIYRSRKGTLWGRLYYWASEARDVEELAEGEAGVRRLIQRARRPSAIDSVFGPLEEG